MKRLLNIFRLFRRTKNTTIPNIFLWLCIKAEEGIANAKTLEALDIIKHSWLRRINDEYGEDRDLAWWIGDVFDKYDAKVLELVNYYYLDKVMQHV